MITIGNVVPVLQTVKTWLDKFETYSKIKKIVIANLLPKLQNVKDLLRPLSKKHRFQILF